MSLACRFLEMLSTHLSLKNVASISGIFLERGLSVGSRRGNEVSPPIASILRKGNHHGHKLLTGRGTSFSKRKIVDISKLASHVMTHTLYCIYARRTVEHVHEYRLYHCCG